MGCKQIRNLEHMIQHETIALKEEKQFIREIKQLKQQREQFSSDMGSQDEEQEVVNKKDQVEERLKVPPHMLVSPVLVVIFCMCNSSCLLLMSQNPYRD